MPNIRVRNIVLDVDIRYELEQFSWTRAKWTTDKLIAASCFRYDKKPSFFINLEGEYAGCWKDSGAYDAEWKSGGFVKLLAYLRNETYEESEEYLLSSYGNIRNNYDTIVLKRPTLKLDEKPNYISTEILSQYNNNYSYLLGRGISIEVQRQANILYDVKSRAVVIPWFDANHRLCNIKYRTTYGKTFWYHKGAVPVRQLVYGIETIKGSVAALCEAEIDALSWRQTGVQAIAVGGANFTDKQADIIKRSPIETLILSGDNDKAGRKLNEQVKKKMRDYITMKKVMWSDGIKDVNEALIRRKLSTVEIIRVNSNIFAV